jgi:hypothetical protein
LLWKDFKTFYAEYDKRRDKSLSVFPAILTDWVATIPTTELPYQPLNSGDGTNIDEPLAKYD